MCSMTNSYRRRESESHAVSSRCWDSWRQLLHRCGPRHQLSMLPTYSPVTVYHNATSQNKNLSSVLRRCLLGGRNGVQTVKKTRFKRHLGRIHTDTSTSYGLFIRVKLVRVERSRSLVRAQTLVIQSSLKIWWKLLNTLNFLQKFTLLSPIMLFVAVYVKITSYLYYVLYK